MMSKAQFILLLTLSSTMLQNINAVNLINTCPATQLSGLEYSRTSASLAGAEDWLQEHKKDLDSLNFIPTSQPKATGGIMTSEMKKAEEKEKMRRSYNKAHITNDIDFELVFHNIFLSNNFKNKKIPISSANRTITVIFHFRFHGIDITL